MTYPTIKFYQPDVSPLMELCRELKRHRLGPDGSAQFRIVNPFQWEKAESYCWFCGRRECRNECRK